MVGTGQAVLEQNQVNDVSYDEQKKCIKRCA